MCYRPSLGVFQFGSQAMTVKVSNSPEKQLFRLAEVAKAGITVRAKKAADYTRSMIMVYHKVTFARIKKSGLTDSAFVGLGCPEGLVSCNCHAITAHPALDVPSGASALTPTPMGCSPASATAAGKPIRLCSISPKIFGRLGQLTIGAPFFKRHVNVFGPSPLIARSALLRLRSSAIYAATIQPVQALRSLTKLFTGMKLLAGRAPTRAYQGCGLNGSACATGDLTLFNLVLPNSPHLAAFAGADPKPFTCTASIHGLRGMTERLNGDAPESLANRKKRARIVVGHLISLTDRWSAGTGVHAPGQPFDCNRCRVEVA